MRETGGKHVPATVLRVQPALHTVAPGWKLQTGVSAMSPGLYVSFQAWEVEERCNLRWVRHLCLWAYSMLTYDFRAAAGFLRLVGWGAIVFEWLTWLSLSCFDNITCILPKMEAFGIRKPHIIINVGAQSQSCFKNRRSLNLDNLFCQGFSLHMH